MSRPRKLSKAELERLAPLDRADYHFAWADHYNKRATQWFWWAVVPCFTIAILLQVVALIARVSR